MIKKELREVTERLDLMPTADLLYLVKYIMGNLIGIDARVSLESWILDEIHATDPEPFDTLMVTRKKDHIAKVLGWDSYYHMDRNRDEIDESTWRAFNWIASFPDKPLYAEGAVTISSSITS